MLKVVAAVLGMAAVVSARGPVVVVSLPGLSQSVLKNQQALGLTLTNFDALATQGVFGANGVKSAFSTDYNPSAYSMATGLHTGKTGIYGDMMYDPTLNETFVDGKVYAGKPSAAGTPQELAEKARWFKGEPVWETLGRLNTKVGNSWVGDSAAKEMQLSEAGVDLVGTMLAAETKLVLMSDTRYWMAARENGAQSTEALNIVKEWDAQLGRLMAILKPMNVVDLILVSHAGMADAATHIKVTGTLVDLSAVVQTSGATTRFYYPTVGEVEGTFAAVQEAHGSNLTVTKASVIPQTWHVSGEQAARLGAVFLNSTVAVLPQGASAPVVKAVPSADGIFLAAGASFRNGRVFSGAVSTVDIYALICKLMYIDPVVGHHGSLDLLQMEALSRAPERQHWTAKQFHLSQEDIVVMPPTGALFARGVRFDISVNIPTGLPGANVSAFTTVMKKDGEDATLACLAAEWNKTAPGNHTKYIARHCEISDAGNYTLTVTSGQRSKVVEWNVRGLPGAGVKNVLLFIGDGMSVAMTTGARLLRRGARLPTDDFEVLGTSFVHALGSIVTDSAASASAINSGHKTIPGMTGQYPDGTHNMGGQRQFDLDNPTMELASEYFRRMYGAKIGVVSTASVVDATPAAVFAHYQDRGGSDGIAIQAIESQPDVLLGGGKKYFTGETNGYTRNLTDEAQALGYSYVTTRDAMKATQGNATKLLGLFEDKHMNVLFDRKTLPEHAEQPSLVEMTTAAIDVLTRNPTDRFYLQVEAASIDKQAHANDHVRMLADALELQNTIKKTMEQLAARGILEETLIVVTSDHATGGYDIYGTVNTDTGPENALASIEVYGAAEWPDYMIDDEGFHVKNWDSAQWAFAGMNNHHPEYREDFKLKHPQGWLYAHYADPSSVNLKGMLAEDSIGQSSSVHTAADVLVYAHGKGASYFQGGHDQTNIFFGIMNAMAPASQPVTSAPATTPAPSPPATTAPAPAVGTPAETVQCHCDKKEVSEGETALIVLVCLLFVLNLGFHIFNMRK
eukprot:TRINITY_DN315_c0_g1_i3.p1 TRINITY_DN315_c0_g1~~TRINITY_DN315_c0_g1_i3.p1  ORF type:complete len:1021 (+),score=420.75 TRINITY_DN315_c0_g1_i3:134-3196(+)